MNRYTVNSLIGEGSFGRVYKATQKHDSKIVAIKIISKRGRSNRELKNLRRECEIQAKLDHVNVIAMLESFETKNDLIVVTEFAYIDLHRFLAKHGVLPEDKAQKLICHLVSALYYLHSNRILHRDLKPQNVLLNEDLHAKLCDFGLARNMTMGTHVLTSIKGTPLYMAPELLAERPYDHLADLWSLGCISYESLQGQPPFSTTSILHLVKLIKYEDVKWPSYLSSDCRSFLQGLLEKEPSLRISWTQILCHPFVEGKLIVEKAKAEDSPYTNPKQSDKEKKKKTDVATDDAADTSDLAKDLASLDISDKTENANHSDNMMSSRDSINAIPASDIENFETDLEDNVSRIAVPFAETSLNAQQLSNNLPKFAVEEAAFPLVNSQTCYVSGNNNLILNFQNDNIPMCNAEEELDPAVPEECVEDNTNVASSKEKVNSLLQVQKTRNKDLEKRKLSQNLDNFSLRLSQSKDTESVAKKEQQRAVEKEKDNDTQKSQQSTNNLKSSEQSTDDKQSSDNSPPCLLPGWDSCDESQSPPIENDEWLAFLQRSKQEILDGELDSLKQQNLVSIIVAPLRNSKATATVVESVAQLLSLPFALNEPESIMEIIKNVYIEVKLVPNLMYASKLLIYQLNVTDSSTSLTFLNSAPVTVTQPNRTIRSIAELNSEEIRTLSRLYELISHLVHLKQQFLLQFCDAVAILAADELLIALLSHDFKNSQAIRISNCILALFLCVLRELPENAVLVEKIIFSPKLNLLKLLQQNNDLLRTRICMLFRLLARFSLRGLQGVWSIKLKQAFEELAENENSEVREVAENTLGELRQFSFYG